MQTVIIPALTAHKVQTVEELYQQYKLFGTLQNNYTISKVQCLQRIDIEVKKPNITYKFTVSMEGLEKLKKDFGNVGVVFFESFDKWHAITVRNHRP